MPAVLGPRQREIRVFVSSTFRDMQEEREELVKRVFPQLRRLCESRAVTWGEVDLRWGITEESKAEGKVLPLCLAEIERCRPYFIGLLGERYGWVPDQIPEELLEAQPWLNEHRKRSVTALEILHGVLLNPAMAEHAFFYFRDPKFAEGRDGFTEEDAERRLRLAELKDDIRRSGLPISENFATPRQLGEWVLRDLTELIDRLYPEASIPDELDRAAAAHEAYAASRRRVYIGRPEYMERLDAHAAGDSEPLVIVGEPGSGKSALLANWTHRWRAQHPDTPVIVHFIGASPDSADWMAMLRRLLGEFQRRCGIEIQIPDQADALRMAFANALRMVAARGRAVLALDALNQLEDRDGAPDLLWLPSQIPGNVRLILSTIAGRARDELKRRGWPTLAVEPLLPEEREQLIGDYLGQYAKQLSPARQRRIATAPQAANALFLATLLNELRLFGSHEQLEQRIGWYLEAANPLELYGKVIARWEQDYGEVDAARGNLVRESLTRLWAARHGLSERELLESLGTQGSPLPRAAWSPLFLAASEALLNRGGLLTFAHDFLRRAVKEAYLPTAALRQGAHRTLAAYFRSRPQGPRQLDELPWQWQEAEEWQSLADLLAARCFFDALWRTNQFEVKTYWTRIEAESPLRMEQVYAAVIQEPAEGYDHAWSIGTLLADTGKGEAALRVYEGLWKCSRQEGDRANVARALGNQALLLFARGDVDGALALYKEQERRCRDIGDKGGLAFSIGNQANIRYVRGDPDGAMALHKEEERLCRELGDKRGMETSLGNQALILKDRGDLDGAMALHKEEERLCRELGNTDGLQASLGNQAVILLDRGDLDGAMTLLREEERLCRELGKADGLQASLGNQSLILQLRGDTDRAMALSREQERLCREFGNRLGLQASLGIQAAILQARGDVNAAMALFQEQEQLCRELGNKDGLQKSLSRRALILRDRGDLNEAMTLRKEQERICRELNDKEGLANSLLHQALMLKDRGDSDGAMTLLREEERIRRELGDKEGLQVTLSSQALILMNCGDLEGAIGRLKEIERLCRELGNKEGLSVSLGNQAVILTARGDLDGAMALHKEEERLCRELGNKKRLSRSLGGQALILKARGVLGGAMALHREEERLCRELGNQAGLANSLGNQAVILQDSGDREGAMALHKEEERICRELGHAYGLSLSLANQALILRDKFFQRRTARRLADEALSIAMRHGYGALLPQLMRVRDSIK